MNLRTILAATLVTALLTGSLAADEKADAAKSRKALQEIGEFIGQWNLDAKPSKGTSWKESPTFGWKFQKDDAWIVIDNKDGKQFSAGEIRYLADKKLYQLTTTDKDKKSRVYTGEFKRGTLKFESKDAKSGDIHRITINTLSEGVRLALNYEVQEGGKGLFSGVYKASGTKEGESFAGGAAAKKPECVVTGGVGTMAVSFNGKTYYVCCSGCRDEFVGNEKKYIDAFEKKNK